MSCIQYLKQLRNITRNVQSYFTIINIFNWFVHYITLLYNTC